MLIIGNPYNITTTVYSRVGIIVLQFFPLKPILSLSIQESVARCDAESFYVEEEEKREGNNDIVSQNEAATCQTGNYLVKM